jgi:serine-type D-Ala-D-Ala carboxypeptidase/endopeptidase (penicillin-binding protein 4)
LVRRTFLPAVAIVMLVAAILAAQAGAAGGGRFCQDLRHRLVRGGGQASGLFVVDARTGKPVCARAARRARPLASNTKIFTTATALSELGPDYRIETRVLADGKVDRQGVLHGDLYLVGGGDPVLGSPVFYNAFLGGLGTDLYSLARQIASRAEIKSVTGRLYADDSIFDRLRGVADSGFATSPYIGPLSGLSFNVGFSTSRGGSFSSDPARLAARKLAASLRGAGVAITADVALGDADPDDTRSIASVESPRLDLLVNSTNVYSNNFFAEMLLKLVGAHEGGGGTTAAGAGVVERFARSRGSALNAVDGSGLTRSNRASPLQVVRFLQGMRSSYVRDEFISDLALAGREGTVAGRMRGTPAYGRCRVKTGTLTGVSNLSGYCFRGRRTMIFSILMGGVRDLGLAHAEQDRIAGAVAGY